LLGEVRTRTISQDDIRRQQVGDLRLENTCGFRNGGNCSGLVAGTFEQPDELVTKRN
jgi:hypothetical protein